MNTCGIHHIQHADFTRCPKCANQTMNTGEQALAAALRHILELNETIERLEDRVDTLDAKLKVRQNILAAISASAVQEPTRDELEQLQRELHAAEEHIELLALANADLEAAMHGRLIASKN